MLKRSGTAVEFLQIIKALPIMRHARMDIRSTKRQGLKKVVIGIGQIHPVPRGKFSKGEAKSIAKVQSWIFGICSQFFSTFNVYSFGQEGFAFAGGGVVRARLHEGQLEAMRKKYTAHKNDEAFFISLAKDWRRSLQGSDTKKRAETLAALNGLALLQAIKSKVTIFPIEQQSVHGAIGENIDRLQKEIGALTKTSAFASYRKKGGKNLTKDEYSVAVQRNALVKEYNRMIKHPSRERAILREVLEHAENPVSVFVLGQGHRHAFLRLARSHMPDDTLFIWITPPQLCWKAAIYRRIVWVSLFLGLLYALGVYFQVL